MCDSSIGCFIVQRTYTAVCYIFRVGVSFSAQSAYWYIDSMKLSYSDRTSIVSNGTTNVILDLSSMNSAATPILYSYHCSTTVLQEQGGNMIIVLNELQVRCVLYVLSVRVCMHL
jgi:hypothetical protein